MKHFVFSTRGCTGISLNLCVRNGSLLYTSGLNMYVSVISLGVCCCLPLYPVVMIGLQRGCGCWYVLLLISGFHHVASTSEKYTWLQISRIFFYSESSHCESFHMIKLLINHFWSHPDYFTVVEQCCWLSDDGIFSIHFYRYCIQF